MAFLLEFKRESQTVSSGNHVLIPAVLAGATSFNIKLDLTNKVTDSAYKAVLSNRRSDSAQRHAMFFWSTTGRAEIAFIIGGSRRVVNTPASSIPLNQRFTLEINYNGVALDVLIDGVPSGSVSASGSLNSFGIDSIGRSVSEVSAAFDLYRLEISANGLAAGNYNPTASNGTGTTLIDTVGGNNGTLVNFPTNNSQWVFYDDGGAITAATAFTMPQFGVSASTSNAVPVFTAESAFTMPQFSVAAQAGIDAGKITVSASFAMPQFSISATASNSVPVFSGSASFTMPQFTVVAQASSIASGVGASVSFAMPQFTITATAESSLPDYIASAAFTMPQFTVQVVSGDAFPSVNARALFKMPQFTVESETINDLFEQPGTYSQPTSNPSIYQV